MSLPPGGDLGGLRAPSSDTLSSSPQLLRQLTSPSLGSLPSSSSALDPMTPGSPLGGFNASMSPSKLPRPPGLGARPQGQRSPGPSPVRKRLKLDLGSVACGPPLLKKRKLFEFRTARLRKVTSAYRDNMGELFFLTNGTNVTDNLMSFRRKPTQQFVNFLKVSDSPARVISEVQTAVLGQQGAPPPAPSTPSSSLSLNLSALPRRPPTSYSPRLLPSAVLSPVKVGEQLDIFNCRLAASVARPSASSPLALPPVSAPIFSKEQVAERVKQEGWVTRRVAELARDGLWPDRRLPRVAERPRALSAWGLVLEEMKWMSADFQQERAWKQAAARVQSSACRCAVVRRQEERQAAELEQGSEVHRRGVARRIAGQVQGWWREVAELQVYETRQRGEILAARQLAQQAELVSTGKRRLEEEQEEQEDGQENGVCAGSDDESTVSEQEAWEAVNWVEEDEVKRLEREAEVPLDRLCGEEYPGYEEDVRERMEVDEGESELWDSDDSEEEEEDAPVNMDALLQGRTVRPEGGAGDLGTLSARAAALAPKHVMPGQGGLPSSCPRRPQVLAEHQSAAVSWLASLHSHRLPALLADERGLGRKAVVSSFLSSLPRDQDRPLLLVCPVSSLSSWQHALALHAPTLSLLTYSGAPADRRRLREEVVCAHASCLVITSYRTLFLDASWFLSRTWELVVQAEAHNIISAGSAEQLRAVVGLRAKTQRIVVVTGQQRANPIDLWRTVYLLFPTVMRQREEQGESEVEVEGTKEYQDTVSRLQGFVASFTLARSRRTLPGGGGEARVWLSLSPGQRASYEDCLARQDSQDSLVRGDLVSVYGVIQELGAICSPALQPARCRPSLPSWCLLESPAHRRFSSLVDQYDPLSNISLDQVNLVFLSQELCTTALTSTRIRSLRASRALITELPEARVEAGAVPVPRDKLAFTLEPVTRAVGGWAVGGLSEGVSLVRAGNGQVYKVGGRPGAAGRPPRSARGQVAGLGAIHPDSVETIGAVNRWRCDGFPLYGQDLIRSLTVTGSVRPAASRFRGQGYVDCLVTGAVQGEAEQEGAWRYRTDALASLVNLGRAAGVETGRRVAAPDSSLRGGSGAKLSALARLLAPLARRGQKVVGVTGGETGVGYLQEVAARRGIRHLVVRGGDTLESRLAAVERWRCEPRLCLLVLAGLTSQTGLELAGASAVILVDSEPGRWEPCLPLATPVHRLVTRATVEEGLARLSTARRLLQDIETCAAREEGGGLRVGRQTLLELLQPPPDNGFTAWSSAVQGKRKEKAGLSDCEVLSTLAAVWSEVTGAAPGSSSCLLDLAELEVGRLEEGGGVLEGEVRLRQWLSTVPRARRRGMQLLRESWQVRQGLEPQGVLEEEEEGGKLSWERKRKAEEEKKVEVPGRELTFPSELVDRVWRSDSGLEPSIYRSPGLGDELMATQVSSGYSTSTILEEELPPVYVPKREKKTPTPIVICQPMSPPALPETTPYSPSNTSFDFKPKIKREEHLAVSAPSAPRSLFDRPGQRLAGRPVVPRRPLGTGTPNYPVAPQQAATLAAKAVVLPREPEAGPDWNIQEDWALHQAVTSMQELPLNLLAPNNGHIANWDMVADMVNAVSRCFRAGKQCRARYEGSLVPREEGRLLYDVTPKKIKKLGKLGMTKPEKKTVAPTTKQAMKTGALYKADNNNAFSTMFGDRFELIKKLANKRAPSTKPLLVNPTMRNPKHAAVLAESGISYESPLTPVMVAANRAERIAREKLRSSQAAALAAQPSLATPALPSQPVAVSQAQARALATAQTISSLTPTSVPLATAPAQAVVVGISQPLQQQHTSPARPLQHTVTALSMADLLKSTGTVTSTVVSAVACPPGLTSAQGRPGQVVITQAAIQGKQGGQQTVQRQLTPQQLAALKQQAILKKQIQDQQLKQRILQTGGQAGGSKTVQGVVQRGGQLVRQSGTVRSMTEAEVKQLMAKQQLKVGAGGVVQVPAGTSLTHAQLQQLGIQVAGSSLVSSPSPLTSATVVKTVQAGSAVAGASTSRPVTIAGASLAGVNLATGQLKAVGGRATPITGSAQQLQNLKVQRQLQLFQKQAVGGSQRVALQPVAGGKGLPAQLIVQGQPGGKGLPATVTVQQLQQIVKSVAGGGQGQATQQIISHAVLAKPGAPGQTVQARVLPVAGGQQRGGQQTIQVVAASPQGGVRGASPSVNLDQLGRPQANALANALAAGNHVKIQAPTGASQQQIISQVSAALASHGQTVSVAVRPPITSGQGVLRTVAPSSQQQGPAQQQQQLVNLQLSVQQQQQQQQQQPAQQAAGSQQGSGTE